MICVYPWPEVNLEACGGSDMTAMEFWVENGCIVKSPVAEGLGASERQVFQRSNYVKVEFHRVFTVVKWSVVAANWASLFYVSRWLETVQGPVVLSFFNAGWFQEKYANSKEAVDRVERLIANSDIRLSARTYLEAKDIVSADMSPQLQKSWDAGALPEHKSVICSVDLEYERSKVAYVGPNSALAAVWGLSPVSFPCQTGHSYDRVVSRPYFDVIRKDKPHYDHVLAAMAQPDGDVAWYSYQRLVMPAGTGADGLPTVRIMSEQAPVDIAVL